LVKYKRCKKVLKTLKGRKYIGNYNQFDGRIGAISLWNEFNGRWASKICRDEIKKNN